MEKRREREFEEERVVQQAEGELEEEQPEVSEQVHRTTGGGASNGAGAAGTFRFHAEHQPAAAERDEEGNLAGGAQLEVRAAAADDEGRLHEQKQFQQKRRSAVINSCFEVDIYLTL